MQRNSGLCEILFFFFICWDILCDTLQVDVIESQFSVMIVKMQATRDFEAIRLAHDQFLSALGSHCFFHLKPVLCCSAALDLWKLKCIKTEFLPLPGCVHLPRVFTTLQSNVASASLQHGTATSCQYYRTQHMSFPTSTFATIDSTRSGNEHDSSLPDCTSEPEDKNLLVRML